MTKKASKSLQKMVESEDWFRQIVENAPECMYVTDAEGTFIDGNKRAEELTGYERSELIGKNVLEVNLFPEKYLPQIIEGIQTDKRGEESEPVELELIKKDGSIIAIEVSSIPINREGKIEVIGIARDISDRKRAEKEIQDLAKFPAENPNPVMRITKEGKILYANKVAREHGCKDKQKNSEVVPEELKKAVVNSLRSGLTEEIEINCSDQAFSFMIAPIPEAGYANVYGRNITEVNAAWESLDESINELVRVNEKLNVVGRLTRHDARNKLSVILNNVYLAKLRLSGDQIALDYLRNVEATVDQIERLFEYAATYNMLGIEELDYSNVEKRFSEAAGLFSGTHKIQFVNECSGLIVLADSLLRQLFYNLIHNSIVHGKEVSQIRVYYETEKNQLKLIYEDDGVGIPDDEKALIFKEGYGKGTGYGLYLIKKICDAYSWTIRENGVIGEGARFVMTIPKTNKDGKASYRFE